MNLTKKLVLVLALTASTSGLRAVGEIPTVIMGAAFGVGYEQAISKLEGKYSAPLVVAGLYAELAAWFLLSGKICEAYLIHGKDEQTAFYKRNFMLMYASSLVAGLATFGTESLIDYKVDLKMQLANAMEQQ